MFSRLGRRRGRGSEASRAAVHPRAPGPPSGLFFSYRAIRPQSILAAIKRVHQGFKDFCGERRHDRIASDTQL